MSTSDAAIRSALETALVAVAGFPAASYRALPNRAFERGAAIGKTWVAVHHLWGNETQTSIPDQGATLERTGILQVDVYTPIDQGTAAEDALIDAIKAAFAPGTVLDVGGRGLRIRESRRRGPAGERDEGWWRSGIDIYWRLRAVSPLT